MDATFSINITKRVKWLKQKSIQAIKKSKMVKTATSTLLALRRLIRSASVSFVSVLNGTFLIVSSFALQAFFFTGFALIAMGLGG